MATATVQATLPSAFATAMELSPAERIELEQWLHLANRGGVSLDAQSVRASSASELGTMLGTR